MRKIERVIISLLFATCMIFQGCGLNIKTYTNFEIKTSNNVKNVILFIGDGMGQNHIENAKTYFSLDTQVFENGYWGQIQTHSNNNSITDSAAAGTSLATGQKVNNSEIARHRNVDIVQITTLAKNNGYKVGVLTTDNLSGATPASFSAHTSNRKNIDEIAISQSTSNIDLFVAQGESDNPYLTTYKQSFIDNNYIVLNDFEDMQQHVNSYKLLCILPYMLSNYKKLN